MIVSSSERTAQTVSDNGSAVDEKDSSRSLMANSMSHSFSNSFYEFRSQQYRHPPHEYKSKNLEKLMILSTDRVSMLTTPVVEFGRLGSQNKA